MRIHPRQMEGLGEAVSAECGRTDQISGTPHPGPGRNVPLVRGIIARRAEGTTGLRMAVRSDPDPHKCRWRLMNAGGKGIPRLCDADKRLC